MARKDSQKISFEEALQELEDIAEKLERGQMSLEDSIKAYERGMLLKQTCAERLEEAEGKIEYLSANPSGKIVKANAKIETTPAKSKTKKKVASAEDEDILF
ncbi:MAG: exodeoxyribonuclease VII small subunit [Spirochaetota bacterium]